VSGVDRHDTRNIVTDASALRRRIWFRPKKSGFDESRRSLVKSNLTATSLIAIVRARDSMELK